MYKNSRIYRIDRIERDAHGTLSVGFG